MRVTMNSTRRISTTPLITTLKELKWTVRIKILTPNCTATERQHILIWVRSCDKHVEHLKLSYTAIFDVWTFDILTCKTFPLSFRRISLLAGFFRFSTLTKSLARASYKPMEKNVARNFQCGSQSGLIRGIFIFSIEN